MSTDPSRTAAAVEETTVRAAQQAQEAATAQAEAQKRRAASQLGNVSDALRRTGDQLGGEQPALAQVADGAAQRLDQVTSYLERTSIREMLDDGAQLARREPAIVLGGAFALGFLAARFLRSTPPDGGGMQTRSYTSGGMYR